MGTHWSIPYNRGFVEVRDGDLSREWVSIYPEAVTLTFDFMYVRPLLLGSLDSDAYSFDVTDKTIRAKIGIQVDGVVYPGSGPFAQSQRGDPYWTGFAGADLASFCKIEVFLPPGAHRATPVAAMGPDVYIGGSSSGPPWGIPGYTADDFIDTTNVVSDADGGPGLGSTKFFLMRKPLALPLGG